MHSVGTSLESSATTAPNHHPQNSVITYPVLPSAPTSINYTATLDGEPVYVEHICGYAGGDVSWISFDFRSTAHISVTALRNVEKVEISPKSAGMLVGLEGNTATVAISQPCRLFLKWNDGFELPFHIFANAIEANPPTETTPGVRYFGPGTHFPGIIYLHSNESLYLAPGALVYGVVQVADAKNVTIHGRGILSTSHLNREKPGPDGSRHDVIEFRNCQDVKVEGITILDSHTWTVVFRNCDQVHVSNVKIFAERNFSTDGINPVNCRDVLIEDCFIRCKDDCISIKGLDPAYPGAAAPIRNIVVQNCVFWSDNNNAVVVGSETMAATISQIVFRNLDLVRVSNTCGDYAGALSIICLHDTEMSDIRFEDIRIEHCTGPYFNFFYCDSIFRIPGARQPAGGTMRDIVLKNVSVIGGPDRRAYISGFDSSRMIENVTIENFRIHGRLISTPEAGRIMLNEFTRSIHFQ